MQIKQKHGQTCRIRSWFAVVPGLLLAALPACTPEPGAQHHHAPAATAVEAEPVSLPSGVGELAPWTEQADGTILVNNRICAQSGAPMTPDFLGRYTNRVVYEGADERFHGRTLVFNQCCAACVEGFPKQWAEHQEHIMQFHGMFVGGSAEAGGHDE